MVSNCCNFRGGIDQRWGLSEELTVGLGSVYDQQFRGLGDLFFQPKNFPLEVAASVLTGNKLIINSNITFQPFKNLTAYFSSDSLSQHFSVNWQTFSFLSFIGTYDSISGAGLSAQFTLSTRNSSTFAIVTVNPNNQYSWSLNQYFPNLYLTIQGNEIGLQSELVYEILGDSPLDSGIALVADYNTDTQSPSTDIAVLSGRYRSQERSITGNYIWEAQLGYGVGSYGSGLFASLSTDVLPGLSLQMRYQGVSMSSRGSSVSLNLISSLDLQGGVNPGDNRSDYFRTEGGLLIQPFYDRDNNGQYNPGDGLYTDLNLIRLNDKEVLPTQAQISSNGILIRVPPGTYRLDLDPSGYPLDWRTKIDAYAVEVVAGEYTPVRIPLVLSYSISGVVTDAQGKAIGGARVEAIPTNTALERRFSVTNDAGVYYIEGLEQATYTLQVNGQPPNPGSITIEKTSKTYQELNLKQP